MPSSQRRMLDIAKRRLEEGKYSAPLPTPDERRSMREAAGLTQQELADELFASRWTVARWERPAGYVKGKRLPGREPVGELRQSYSELPRTLERES